MSLIEHGNRIAADLDRLRVQYAQALEAGFLEPWLTEGRRAAQAAAYGRRVRERIEEVRQGYLRDAYRALRQLECQPYRELAEAVRRVNEALGRLEECAAEPQGA